MEKNSRKWFRIMSRRARSNLVISGLATVVTDACASIELPKSSALLAGFMAAMAADLTDTRNHISPDEAEKINSDPHLKTGWSAVNDDINNIYKVLGPPPLPAPLEAGNGR